MCVCVCVCVYSCTHARAHAHTHAHTHTYACRMCSHRELFLGYMSQMLTTPRLNNYDHYNVCVFEFLPGIVWDNLRYYNWYIYFCEALPRLTPTCQKRGQPK